MEIDVKKVVVQKERGRKDFSGVPNLMESIKKLGLIHPIVVREITDGKDKGKYELLAGEGRLRAVLLLGWKKVPANLLEDVSPLERKEIELEENLVRQNLEWSEQIELQRQIDNIKRERAEEKGKPWDTRDTAKVIGVGERSLYRNIAFAKKLQERPDIKEKVRGLPLNVAMKAFEQEEEKERRLRLKNLGMLKSSKRLRLGDSLDLIKEVEAGSVDAIITDPPFGLKDLKQRQHQDPTVSYKQVLTDTDNASKEKVLDIMESLGPEFQRVLKPGGYFFVFFAIDYYAGLIEKWKELGLNVRNVPLIWDKQMTTAAFMGYTAAPCYESIMYGNREPRKRLKVPIKEILRHKPLPFNKKVHPFEKPGSLLKELIECCTSPGELVFDPFAGSGGHLIAALELERSALGFEVDEGHFLRAQKRLEHWGD